MGVCLDVLCEPHRCSTHRGQMRASELLELVVAALCMLGTKTEPSGQGVRDLNHWVISPASHFSFKDEEQQRSMMPGAGRPGVTHWDPLSPAPTLTALPPVLPETVSTTVLGSLFYKRNLTPMLAPGTWLQLDLKLCKQRNQQPSSNKRRGGGGSQERLHTCDDIDGKHVWWALSHVWWHSSETCLIESNTHVMT